MLAMQLSRHEPIAASPLRLVELPDPEPGAGELRIQVTACAICRTDLHVIEGDLPRGRLPIIPGHQVVGVVDRLGSGCHRFRPGERVGAAWLAATCGSCAFCASGRENLCETSLFTGYDRDGGFAHLAVVREDFAYPIPQSLDETATAPLLCAGIIGYRALARSQLPKGGKLGLYGFGSSAHIVTQLARFQGAEIFVVTRGAEHQALARELGASWVGASPADLPVRLDSAILFAPAGELVPAALESLKKGGTLAVAGIHLSRIPELDYQRHLFFERDLRSVTANTRQDGEALLALAAGLGPSLRLHTRTYPLEEANQALLDLKEDRIRGTGILAIG